MADEIDDKISAERRFLHDFATPMSIVRLHTKRLQRIGKEKNWSEVEIKLLEQILESVTQMELVHGTFKEFISKKKGE